MKKILLTFIMLIFPLRAYAFEDYMIFSDTIVRGVVVEDNNIADVLPVQTIDNNKQIILFKPKKQGTTFVIVKIVNGERRIKVDIDESHTWFENIDFIDIKDTTTPQLIPINISNKYFLNKSNCLYKGTANTIVTGPKKKFILSPPNL